MNNAIDAADVTKQYQGEAGVRALDLSVESGSVVGLIGPSGAGKTTAVRLLTGLLARENGTLKVLDQDPEKFTPAVRSRIGYLPQDSALYPTLTVRQNLDFAAALQGMRGKARARACERTLEFVELTDVQSRRAADLSGGMRRRASLAGALVHRPDLLFLDEPTAGLDPILRRNIWDHLDQLGRDGRTLVVTTQYVGEAAYCDYIVFLVDGEMIEFGRPEDLRRRAFGGELVDVVFSERPDWHTTDTIARGIEALATDPQGVKSVRYTVADAGSSIPRVTETATDAGIEIVEVERFIPDFDDVFVKLVDQHERSDSAA